MADLEKILADATPGPWRICETTIHGRKYGGCWVEGPDADDGDGRPHGILIPISGSGCSMSYTTRVIDVQDHDHNDANARLIALAPQITAALVVAERALEIALDDLNEWVACKDSLEKAGFNMDDTAKRAETVRAALDEIAKLTGGRQ